MYYLNINSTFKCQLLVLLASVVNSFFGISVSYADSTSVTVPVSATYAANVEISAQPTAINFGVIVSDGQWHERLLTIVINSDAVTNATVSLSSSCQLLDEKTCSLGGGHLRVLNSTQSDYLYLNGQVFTVGLTVGDNNFAWPVTLNVVSQSLGRYNVNLRVTVQLT